MFSTLCDGGPDKNFRGRTHLRPSPRVGRTEGEIMESQSDQQERLRSSGQDFGSVFKGLVIALVLSCVS